MQHPTEHQTNLWYSADMKSHSYRLVAAAQLVTLLFLAVRAILWLQDHTARHYALDLLTLFAVALLLVLFVIATPDTKPSKALKYTSGMVITVLGAAMLLVSLAGLLVALNFMLG